MSETHQVRFTSEFEYTYEVEDYIGAGAYGTVYKCNQIRFLNVEETERVVAVKLIELKEREENRVKNEINLLRQLNHPNVIKIFKSWVEYPPPRYTYIYRAPLNKTSKGAIFIETEFCDLETLRHWFQHDWRKRDHAKVFLYQILSGVKYLHDKEIIHRDMKPENILLRKEGSGNIVTAKIGDFGISRERATFMTSKIGTYGYISPEVLKGKQYTKKADVYAVGVMFYEMLVLIDKENEDMSDLLAGMMLNDETNYEFQFIPNCEHLINYQEKSLIQSMVEVDVEKRPHAIEILQMLCHTYLDIKNLKISTTEDDSKKQALLQREQEERSRIKREEAEKARLKHEEKEKARINREEEENARIKREEAENARVKREEAEKARIKREKEGKAPIKREEEEKARLKREQEEKSLTKRKGKKQVRPDEEEMARIKRVEEWEARVKREEEEKSRIKRNEPENVPNKHQKEENVQLQRAKKDKTSAAAKLIARPIRTSTDDGQSEINQYILRKEKLLNYLKTISHSINIISGMDTGLKDPYQTLEKLKEITGVSPGIMSLYTPDDWDDMTHWKKFVEKVFSVWNSSSFVVIKWKISVPWYKLRQAWYSTSYEKRKGDFMSDGKELQIELKQLLDNRVHFLQELQTKGVVPIIDFKYFSKSLHNLTEKEQKKFFELTRNYLTSHHGLHSLVWSWNINIDTTVNANLSPENDFFDMASVVLVSDKELSSNEYETLVRVVGDKPIALECLHYMPTPTCFLRQPRWAWFTYDFSGSNLFKLQNSRFDGIFKVTFKHPSVINRGNIDFFHTETVAS